MLNEEAATGLTICFPKPVLRPGFWYTAMILTRRISTGAGQTAWLLWKSKSMTIYKRRLDCSLGALNNLPQRKQSVGSQDLFDLCCQAEISKILIT